MILLHYDDGYFNIHHFRYRVAYNKETGVCKLEISMTFADDAGEYTIVARNQMGEASTSTSLLEERKSDQPPWLYILVELGR